uniref:cDNA n=1 Tax=Macrostomum lignano TaxID=282301 RepID=A0A1I8IHP4_9PLAT
MPQLPPVKQRLARAGLNNQQPGDQCHQLCWQPGTRLRSSLSTTGVLSRSPDWPTLPTGDHTQPCRQPACPQLPTSSTRKLRQPGVAGGEFSKSTRSKRLYELFEQQHRSHWLGSNCHHTRGWLLPADRSRRQRRSKLRGEPARRSRRHGDWQICFPDRRPAVCSGRPGWRRHRQ